MGVNKRLLAGSVVSTLAVATTSWVLLVPTTAPVEPPPTSPMFADDVPPAEGGFLRRRDDGFNHFIVEVQPASISGDTSVAERAESEKLLLDLVRGEEALTPDELRTIDPELAEALIEQGLAAGPTADKSAEAAVVAYLESLDGIEAVTYLHTNMAAITVGADVDMSSVAALPGVDPLVEDLLFPMTDGAVDGAYRASWHLDAIGQSSGGTTFIRDADIDAPEAWDHSRGEGVVIAVIDSGFPADTAELAPNVWMNPGETCGNGVDDDGNGLTDDCRGWDFSTSAPHAPWDGSEAMYMKTAHGVSVAAIAAAPDGNGGVVGVAPEADLMLLGTSDDGEAASSATVLPAIYYAIEHGADIINLSFGGLIPADEVEAHRALWDPVLDAAEAAGTIVVAAAGNADSNAFHSPSMFVAERPNGMAVGASTATDERAHFSNFGESVTLFAPGESVVTNFPNDHPKRASGTSYSSPIAAGAAAVAWATHPAATAAEIVAALEGGADPVSGLSSLTPAGRRLNVERAIAFLAGADLADFTFTDLSGLGPTAAVGVSAPRGDAVSFALTTMIDGRVVSVPGFEVGWNGQTATTDETGTAFFQADVTGGVTSSISIDALPGGAYGLVAEALDAGVPVDAPTLSVFTVDSALSDPGSGEREEFRAESTPISGTGPTTTIDAPASQAPTNEDAGEDRQPGDGTGGPPDEPAPTTTTTSTPSASTVDQAPDATFGDDAPQPPPTTQGSSIPAITAPAEERGATTTSTEAGVDRDDEDSDDEEDKRHKHRGNKGKRVDRGEKEDVGGDVHDDDRDAGGQRDDDGEEPQLEPDEEEDEPEAVSVPSPSGIRLTTVSPRSLPTSGGSVVIHGRQIPEYPVVLVDGVPARVVERMSSRKMVVAITSGEPGWHEITVHPADDPEDTAHLTNAFKFSGRVSTSTTAPRSTTLPPTDGGAVSDQGTTPPLPDDPEDPPGLTGPGGDDASTGGTTEDGDPPAGGNSDTEAPSLPPTAGDGQTATDGAGPGSDVRPSQPNAPIPDAISWTDPWMGWNVPPAGIATGTVPQGAEGIDSADWNAAYQAAGTSTGVRLDG